MPDIKSLLSGRANSESFHSLARGKQVFAFDFGEFAVKVAVLKIKKTGVEIKNLFAIENQEKLSKLDARNIRDWKNQIQRAFAQRKIAINEQPAVCTVGGNYYLHRQLEIPFVGDADRNGLVENEMSQLLSLEPSSYVFQSELLSVKDSEDGKKAVVWAVAMPKDTMTAAYELLRQLHLRPAIMDVHVNGLRRLVSADQKLLETLGDKTAVFIDYGMSHTELSFLKQGQLLSDVQLDYGDSRLVAEARNVLGAGAIDAQNSNKLTMSPQIVCDILQKATTSPTARAFSLVIEDWLKKVNTAILHFNLDHPSEPVKNIFLYGGSPQSVWLVQYLAGMAKIPASVLSQSELYNLDSLGGSGKRSCSAYLNALNLSLMD